MVNNVDHLADKAKYEPKVKENLITDYIPYMMSCAQKVTGHYIDNTNDEEYSIVLEAFSEAIDTYQIEKGPFLSFSYYVIKYRLYDYYRKTKKLKEKEVFDDISSDKSTIVHLSEKAAIENYYEKNRNDDLALEIKMFSQELKDWDISFEDLTTISPKHAKTRKLCIDIGYYISDNIELLNHFHKNKQLPGKNIKKTFNIPLKKFERFRKYIIAVVIIRSGNYEQLSEYIQQ